MRMHTNLKIPDSSAKLGADVDKKWFERQRKTVTGVCQLKCFMSKNANSLYKALVLDKIYF